MKKIMGGGKQVIVAMRGRNIVDGKRKDFNGAPTIQRLEINMNDESNCLTGVQKDNLVIQINPSTESGGKQPFQQNRVYDTDGILPALSSQLTTGAHNILVKSATKEGFEIASEGDSINLSMPNSKTRRGRVGVAQTLDTQSNQSVLLAGNIRRLTEIECERLQGYPEIEVKILLEICLENQKKNVNVDSQNLKLPRPVLAVEEKESNPTVNAVGENLNISNQQTKKPVQKNVLINLEGLTVGIHNQEKLLSHVSIAEIQKKLTPMKIDDFVLLIVMLNQLRDQVAISGKEGLQVNEQFSIHQKSGNIHVKSSGKEIMQLAKDVKIDSIILKKLLKSTTSDLLNNENLEQTLTTLFYYAIHVITGFTQMQIQNENLLIEIIYKHGWTEWGIYEKKVWINKKEKTFEIVEGKRKIPRTQRYKLCGNAVTVDVVEMIGIKLLPNF